MHEEQERDNPNPRQEENNEEDDQHQEENIISNDNDEENDEDEEHKSTGSAPIRSTRERTNVERLEPSMKGKSYLQEKRIKKVRFKENVKETMKQKEYCHNLVMQTKQDQESTIEYEQEEALVVARLIEWLN